MRNNKIKIIMYIKLNQYKLIKFGNEKILT